MVWPIRDEGLRALDRNLRVDALASQTLEAQHSEIKMGELNSRLLRARAMIEGRR
jgi:hypothetical protein